MSTGSVGEYVGLAGPSLSGMSAASVGEYVGLVGPSLAGMSATSVGNCVDDWDVGLVVSLAGIPDALSRRGAFATTVRFARTASPLGTLCTLSFPQIRAKTASCALKLAAAASAHVSVVDTTQHATVCAHLHHCDS